MNLSNYNLTTEGAAYKCFWLPEVVEMRAEYLVPGAILLNENNDASFPTRMGFKMGRATYPDDADQILMIKRQAGRVGVIMDVDMCGKPTDMRVFEEGDMVKVAGISGVRCSSSLNNKGLFYKLFFWGRSDSAWKLGNVWHWDVLDGKPCWVSNEGDIDSSLSRMSVCYAGGTFIAPFAPAAPWVLESLKQPMPAARGVYYSPRAEPTDLPPGNPQALREASERWIEHSGGFARVVKEAKSFDARDF